MLESSSVKINSRADLSILYSIINSWEPCALIIDLTKYPFFSPLDIVLLAQLIIRLINLKFMIFMNGDFEGKQKYLVDIGLPLFCQTNHAEPTTIAIIESQTAMPIKRLATSTMPQYIFAAQNFIHSLCPSKNFDVLDIGLSELINNVYDHSESPIGAYVFCQYYPNSRVIKFAVGDVGIGIPYKVAKFLKGTKEEPTNKRQCIQWAFGQKKTIKSTPRNAGLGLYNIMDFVTSNNGRINLLSDEVRMISLGGRNYFSKNPIKQFNGTVVEIEILVDNLPEFEQEFSDFEI